MPKLVGERVTLRDYRKEDLASIRKWVNESATVQYLSTVFWPPQTIIDTQEFLDRMLAGSHNGCNFVISRKEDENYIGQLDLFRLDWKLRCGELGMVIGGEEDRGQGYGTEALQLLLRYAFLTLGLERVELTVDIGNERAKRCYEKAGFILEGVKRHAFYRDGVFCDVCMMSALRDEWIASRC